jgi:hypothetical protein
LEEARYHSFLEGRKERPGASGASWIRFETAGTSFCVHILPTIYFILLLGGAVE